MLYNKKLNQLVSNGLNYVYDGRADPEPDAATEPDAEPEADAGAAEADADPDAAGAEAEAEPEAALADAEPQAEAIADALPEHGAADAEHGAAETEAEHGAAETTDAEHEELKCEFNLSFSYPTRIPFETNFLTQKS